MARRTCVAVSCYAEADRPALPHVIHGTSHVRACLMLLAVESDVKCRMFCARILRAIAMPTYKYYKMRSFF